MTEAHDLQVLLWPISGVPADLYAGRGSGGEVTEAGHLLLRTGQRFEANSYFNAFFPAYWSEYAGLRRIGLRCRARGQIWLQVTGRRRDGSSALIGDWLHLGDAGESLHWLVAEGTAEGWTRLSVGLRAEQDAVVEEVAFVGEHPPRRDLRIVIGIVTHDREELLAGTLAALSKAARQVTELRRVIVVNHGAAFRRTDLRDLAREPLLRVIRQPNLGGCGGFARAMVEATDDTEHPTHLILMDDDVVVDMRMLQRAILFARQTIDPVVVGAQALELERPRRLQEAWGEMGPGWRPMMRGTGQDMGDPARLTLWEDVARPDYNGWWFCMMPVDAIRDVGLPMPVFIRGDDIEYGIRLGRRGWPIVPLPGLAVWHASVHFKHVGLVQYYEQRNLLIAAACHPEVAPLPPVIAVLGHAVHHLLVHRYRAAAASLLALEDFLSGSEIALGPPSDERHRALSQRLAHVPFPERILRPEVGGMHRPRGFLATSPEQLSVGGAVLLILRILLLPSQDGFGQLQFGAPDPLAIGGRPYLLATDADAEVCLAMRARRWLFLRLLVRAIRLSLRYGLHRHHAARGWLRKFPDLCGRERWMQEFRARKGKP
ncbi:glycosyltransferase [Tabrizicola sp. M-4]|uniref:glycosyltransferase n=1 Tax=Tabrizicola sp. M-4 TaxID=3055847 RepID=UPI003DA83BA3